MAFRQPKNFVDGLERGLVERPLCGCRLLLAYEPEPCYRRQIIK
jgi:hypothetical protein